MSAESLKTQGIDLYTQHDYEAANRMFQQAKDAYEEESNYDMVAEMKVNIGLVHRSLGESQQALEMMQEAMTHFKDHNDKLRLAQVLGNLGGVYQALNDKQQAEITYHQAADLFKELGEDDMYSDTMMALGQIQIKDGQFLAGATTYQAALENRDNLSGTQKIIRSLANLVTRLLSGSA